MMAPENRLVELLPKDINGPYQTTFVALVSRKKLKDTNKVISHYDEAQMFLLELSSWNRIRVGSR